MKLPKFLLMFVIFIPLFVYSAAEENKCPPGTYYKMASYVQDGRAAQQTPLFNLQIFNGGGEGCFPIATQEQTGVTSYNNGIQFLFDLMIGVSIALAVILFTFGAAQGITNDVFGQNMSTKSLKEGKDTMENSLIGLMIILGMWLVINTINPDLLRLPALQGLYQLNTAGKAGNSNTGVVGRPGA